MKSGYSREAEDAIEKAEALLSGRNTGTDEVRKVDASKKYLPHQRGVDKIRRVLHKECYNGILQLRSSLCNTVQNVRQSGL